MAKIINDSLITSKPNAPLDVRTEVATLADVVNISNPSESLVFKVLETGKYYKIDSLKTVQIEGTTLTKKIIESFSPLGDVEEAPKDGGKYYRQNGVWVKVDESIDPALPILMINLKSDRGSDDTIERLKFTVKYASVVTELGSGQRINVPYGARLVVEFPSVEGYNKPNDIVVDDVTGNVVQSVTYEYLISEVNVYVSSEDGTPVDGQVVSVEEYSLFENIPNGAYIESVDGVLYDNNSWNAKKTANSVVVVTDKQKVRIALSMEYTGDSSALTSDKTGTDVLSDAILDFNGEEHTNNDSSPRVKYWNNAKEYSFANGMSGAYIPALGELNNIKDYWADILKCFAVLGVEIKGNSLASSTSSSNYSSIYSGYSTWCINMATGEMKVGTIKHAIIYFKTIDASEKLKDVRKNNYEVLGGKANFNAIKGNEVVVSINKKEGDYGTPESVTFVADGKIKNISMMYVKLLIDTIYINNLCADRESIVSGQMNGPAVKAIMGDIKRYLGKHIEEDGNQKLILSEVDQHDNNYFVTGEPIGLEGLGTNAFLYTYHPSWSYKITPMENGVYKIQICYKHKPDEDWQYYDSRFVAVYGVNNDIHKPIVKIDDYIFRSKDFDSSCLEWNEKMSFVDFYDYSMLTLLYFAKYGVIYADKTPEQEDGKYATNNDHFGLYKFNYAAFPNMKAQSGAILLTKKDGTIERFDNEYIVPDGASSTNGYYVKSLHIDDRILLLPTVDKSNNDASLYYPYRLQWATESSEIASYFGYKSGDTIQVNYSSTAETRGPIQVRVQYIGDYNIVDINEFAKYVNIWK